MDNERGNSKISEWCGKLMINTVKCIQWIEEVKHEATPEHFQTIRNIINVLVEVLPDDRETVNFLLQ